MKPIQHIIIAAATLITPHAVFSQGHGEIRGVITDTDKAPVPFATVRILQDNHLVGGAQTDEEGNYHYKPLVPGTYDILVSEAAHVTQPLRNIRVGSDKTTYVNVKLALNALAGVTVVAAPLEYIPPSVDPVIFHVVDISAEELNRNASYNRGDLTGALEALTSDVISGPGGEVHFRGGRGGSSGYFVDGVRTLNEVHIPGLAIENISIFTGGVPAMYGDLTAGAVIVTTKSYFSGMREKNIRLAKLREDE
jgi:hypothetical protein